MHVRDVLLTIEKLDEAAEIIQELRVKVSPKSQIAFHKALIAIREEIVDLTRKLTE